MWVFGFCFFHITCFLGSSMLKHQLILPFNHQIILHWIHNDLFIHSSIKRYLCCFELSAIENSATVNTHVQVFVWLSAFNSFGYVLRSGTTGSHQNSTLTFLRNGQSVSQSSYNIWHYYYQCIEKFQFLYTVINTYLPI